MLPLTLVVGCALYCGWRNIEWREKTLVDDPVVESNTRGTISFATSGPDSRTTQMFINFGDNSRLDGMGFSPFGKVVDGMDVVDRIYKVGEKPNQVSHVDVCFEFIWYNETTARDSCSSALPVTSCLCTAGHQGQIQSEGNRYLKSKFPKLTFIKDVRVVPAAPNGEL